MGEPPPSFEKTHGGFPRIEQILHHVRNLLFTVYLETTLLNAKVYMPFKNCICGPEINLVLEELEDNF